MVVAVVAVRVVEVPAHPIVGVARMGHGLVTAARTVRVLPRVLATRVLRSARRRIRSVFLEQALDDVLVLHVMQVAVVQVVDVPLVGDRRVLAPPSVLVRMTPVPLLRHVLHLLRPPRVPSVRDRRWPGKPQRRATPRRTVSGVTRRHLPIRVQRMLGERPIAGSVVEWP